MEAVVTLIEHIISKGVCIVYVCMLCVSLIVVVVAARITLHLAPIELTE
jgi:hypothetical protein